MAERSRGHRRVRRLWATLSLTWAAAWMGGVALFATVVLDQDAKLRRQSIHGELALRAAAVYGLVWFEADGTFHDEAVRGEDWLVEDDVEVWVIVPGSTSVAKLAPRGRVGVPDGHAKIAARALEALDPIDTTIGGLAVHAIPTFPEGDQTEPCAAILVAATPDSLVASRPLAHRVIPLALVIGLLGIGVGRFLAHRSVRPVVDALDQRERFLVAAAHELRSPVASLLAVCESGHAGDEPPDRALQRAGELAARTARTVDDLLLFARLDAGQATLVREPVRLDALVESELEDDVPVLTVAPAVVTLDPGLARVALRNVLNNAFRHGKGDEHGIEVVVEGATVTVADRGPGFPDAVLDLTTGPIALAPSRAGAGVGLATCRMIVSLHGGAMTVNNRSAGGAEVRINWEPRVT